MDDDVSKKKNFKVSEVSCFLIEKIIIPIVSSNNPVSLIQTKVPPKGVTPLLSNKMFGNIKAKVPTENAMMEAIVKKTVCSFFVNIGQQRSTVNILIHLMFIKK